MYLSYFLLDMKKPSVRQCLFDAHDMHRSVMAGFRPDAGDSPRSALQVLYRLMPHGQQMRLYVLSKEMPDWSHVSPGFTLAKPIVDVSGTVASLKNGRLLAFDLLAVPSKKTSREDANSQRVFLTTQEERLKWLERKAQQHGFSVAWVREDGQSKVFAREHKGGESATHTGVRFRGELRIAEETAFQAAFCGGIGAAKAYGMGMLLLFPPGR